MPLRRLLPLLSCPLCVVDGGNVPYPLLHHPFTLRCGHTVCSSHLKTADPAQPCPLPVCSSTPNPNTARPNIPSSSRVIYLPAVPPPPSAPYAPSDQLEQRVDITISKLIEVVSRHSQPPTLAPNQRDSDHSDGDGHQDHPPGQVPPRTSLPSSDEEIEFRPTRDLNRSSGLRRRRRRTPNLSTNSAIPNHSESTLTSASTTSVVSADSGADSYPSSSGHSGRSPPPRTAGGESSDGSDLSPEPPRKRPRRDTRSLVTDRETQSRAIEPGAETGNSDNQDHPSANGPQPDRFDAEPRRDPEESDQEPRTRINKELLTELSCDICFTIYHHPVTTPCQHTFCGRCLQRSLDSRSHCPICRMTLPDDVYVYVQDAPQNKVVLSIELEVFPELYAERGRAIAEEERNARLNTPLFVCQLSFPGVPMTLHLFERRYRSMLRRCLESPTPRFGMVMPPKSTSTGATSMDFGTMLEIRSVKMLAEGRSLVYTWGVSRFRILDRDTFDGYMVGRIEYIEDFPEELKDTLDAALEEKAASEADGQNTATDVAPAPTTSLSATIQTPSTLPPPIIPPDPEPHLLVESDEALMNKCRTFVEQLRDGAAPWIVQKLNDSYGNMPTDMSNFSFWVALVLPIDEYEKAKLLPIRSARLRLKLVAHWIDQLNGNW